MKASKIFHRNEMRIRIDFPYNAEMVLSLRQIPDARWSKTMGAWHVPYSKEGFVQLKTLFPELEYTSPPAPLNLNRPEVSGHLLQMEKEIGKTYLERGEEPPVTQSEKLVAVTTQKLVEPTGKVPNIIEKESVEAETIQVEKPEKRYGGIDIVITRTLITIALPKNEADIQFLRTFKYAKWDYDNFCWVIPPAGADL